jgi:hypothetical protein
VAALVNSQSQKNAGKGIEGCTYIHIVMFRIQENWG